MAGFVEGADRAQSTLLPECLDDWVDESNPVRFIDAFVDGLDLKALGFAGVDPADTGRPAYHASVHLKLYVYGYLNRVHSSRRLEREAGRNLEVMWLLQRLAPDFKTIADFRKDERARHQEGVRAVYRGLPQARFAQDGQRRHRRQRVQGGQQPRQEFHQSESGAPEKAIGGERFSLSLAARHGRSSGADRSDHAERIRLKDKLEKLHSEMAKLDAMEKQMLASPDEQISLTDPDSRSMATSGRGSGVVGYNVQVATETEHHLIIAHEVTNVGSDRSQLAKVAKAAKEVLQVDKLEAVADRGYYHGEEIKACADASITVTLPKPLTSGAKSEGRFGKQDFAYLADEDVYRCPAGEKLRYYYTNEENGQKLRNYWTNACRHCALKPRCTSATPRRIKRWEHEHVLEAVQERLDRNPDAMRTRREVVEHPFGTIKMRMGATHFLMKTLPKVATEMALAVLGYNLTRVINIVGVARMMEAVRA